MHTIHHVGLVVPSIERHLEKNHILYDGWERSSIVVNEKQGVKEMFVCDGNVCIELLEPLNDASPLASALARNPLGSLVHVCYECDDLHETVVDLQADGAKLISGPMPDIAFDDNLIAFMFVNGQVVELVQR